MPAESPKANIRKIINAVAKALRPLRFTRRGNVLTRPVHDGIVQVIHFGASRLYRSDPGDSDDYEIFCNCGVYVPSFWRAYSSRWRESSSRLLPANDKVDVGYCSISTSLDDLADEFRAGLPIGHGGCMEVNEATMALLPRYIDLIVKIVVPWLDELQSNDHIVERYRMIAKTASRQMYGLNAVQAAVIRASQGRMEEAEALFDEIRQGPRPGSSDQLKNPEYLEYVNEMREAVGLKPYPIEELLTAWGFAATELSSRSTAAASTAPTIRLSEPEQAQMREHLGRLAELGLRPRRGVSAEDIAALIDPESFTGNPVLELLAALGGETEDERPRRICDRVLPLDSECIETPRDLVRVMKWLGALTGKALAIRGIKAGIDPLDELSFLVSFELDGRCFNWRLENNEDWLDPEMLLRYDELLAAEGAGIAIFEVLLEAQGQDWLLVALAPGDERKLAELGQLTVRRVSDLREAG